MATRGLTSSIHPRASAPAAKPPTAGFAHTGHARAANHPRAPCNSFRNSTPALASTSAITPYSGN
jgi:hypothetical protein